MTNRIKKMLPRDPPVFIERIRRNGRQALEAQIHMFINILLNRAVFMYIAAVFVFRNDKTMNLIPAVFFTMLLAPAIEYFVSTFHPKHRLLTLVALLIYCHYLIV